MKILSTLHRLWTHLLLFSKKILATWNRLSDYLEERNAPDWLVVLAPFLFFGCIVGVVMTAGSVAIHFALIAAPIVWGWLILLAKIAAVLFILFILGLIGAASASAPITGHGPRGVSNDTLDQILNVERERLTTEKNRDLRDRFRL